MPPLTPSQTHWSIGVDVGGTFTDLVAYDGHSLHVVKIPSTPGAFHKAVIDAVNRVNASGLVQIVHGSTVATNALLQRAGEPIALLTTEGFADILLIARQNRPRLYALKVQRPAPITSDCFEIPERIGASGEIVQPLDESALAAAIHSIVAKGIKHIAICFLFSFVNPIHEDRAGDLCRRAGLTVSLSHQLLPEFREYERASTTAINASLRPTVEAYLNALESGLSKSNIASTPSPGTPGEGRGEGSSGQPGTLKDPKTTDASNGPPTLRIMHSSGGTLTPTDAAQFAARLVLSGPAGGILGAGFVASAAGFQDVITYDMGGTSTDVATILQGRPHWTTSSTIDGLPIALPMFDIHTVGAGGGSVAYLDTGGALRVGPKSAGAQPGPACYNRGGAEPTVTDANLLLGRILPEHFLGGAMEIRRDLALRVIEALTDQINQKQLPIADCELPIGDDLSLSPSSNSQSAIRNRQPPFSPTDTALGIIKIAEANMEAAIRAVTSRRGHDPRHFTLVSFGGAGGLHACAIAANLDIPRVLIPPYAGVLSALGMVVAPPVAEASNTVIHLGTELDDARLAAEFGQISGRTMETISYEQTAAVEPFADVRFKGQSHELTVPVRRPCSDEVTAAFLQAYTQTYGQPPANRAIEIVTLRVRRTGKARQVSLPPVGSALADVVAATQNSFAKANPAIIHTALITAEGAQTNALVFNRAQLLQSGPTPGPFLLIDPEATTYIPPGWRATAQPNGSIIATRPA